VLQYSVTVWPDRIEYANGFTRSTLLRSAVQGYRRSDRGRKLRLIPSDGSQNSVTVSSELLTDPHTKSWFDGIPDIEARELRAAQVAFAEDPRLGDAVDLRCTHLAQLEKFAKGLDYLGAAIGIWALIWPAPYAIAILSAVATVLLALALKVLSHSLFSLRDDARTDPRPKIGMLFSVPAIAVMARAVTDINLIDWLPVLQWSFCIAAVLAIPILSGEATFRSKPAVTAFLLLLAYGFSCGALAELNRIFDTSQPVSFRTTIRGMHVSSGKSHTYRLTLDGWANRPTGTDVKVSSSFYNALHVGDTVCIYLSTGWLGYRYYDAGYCAS
jgi:hypothetical protein